jgi:Putative prokaryotic signal transducing protein
LTPEKSRDARLKDTQMKEMLRTNDLVLLSYATHVLAEAGIEALVFDAHISAVEGSIGAFPRRLMVQEEDFGKAMHELDNVAITGQQ